MFFWFVLVIVAAIQGPCLSDGSLVPAADVAPITANLNVESEVALDFDRKKKPGKKGKKPTKKPAKKPTNKPAKKPAKKPGKKPTSKPAKKPSKKPAKKPGKKPAKKPGKKPSKKPGKKPGKKPSGSTGSSTTTPCNCGVKSSKKIVNGQNADEFEWPWIARLSVAYNSGTYQCGGSLIADQWILTAAHCTVEENGKLPTVTVYMGDHDKSWGTTDTNEKVISVSKIINHASYDANGAPLNDITLLKLSKKVDMTKYTPACLPEATSTYVGKMTDVYGWGTTSYGGNTPDILKETQVEIISNSACSAQGYGSSITSKQICAYTKGTDACQGDSGGPLTYNNNNKHELIGVVSYGNGCAYTDYSGVYTRVTEYLAWIKTQTEKNGGAVYCDNA